MKPIDKHKEDIKNELTETLRKAEMKRVGERLTKKELCNIYGFNYNFYMNCVSNRNQPSKQMADSLHDYLNTPTEDVFRLVFASRNKESDFHEKLNIEQDEANEFLEKLTNNDVFKEPRA
jgi:DNA-binding XRE family transcriptional regulator